MLNYILRADTCRAMFLMVILSVACVAEGRSASPNPMPRVWQVEVDAVDQLLKASPGDPVLAGRKVHALRMMGDFDDALAAAKAIPAEKMDAKLADECAWVYIQLGKWNEAIGEAERVLVLDPTSVDAHLVIGIASRELGDTLRARQEFQNMSLQDPESAVALFNLGRLSLADKDWKTAIEYFDHALKLDPSLAEAYYHRARAHVGAGSMAKAMEDLNAAIAKMPTSAPPYLLRAELNEQMARCDAAAGDSYTAIQLGSKEIEAYLILARAAEVMRDWKAMEIAAAKAIDIDAKSARAWHLLGRAQREIGEQELALQSLGQAITIAPTAQNTLLERAAVYISMQKYDLAAADCSAVINKQPSAFAYALRGFALLKQNKFDKAFDDANNAVSLNGREATGLLVRANISLEWKNVTAARQDALRAVSVAPTMAWASMTLAEIELLANDGKKAVAAASTAIQLAPADGAAYWLRGRCRRMAGDYQGAAKDFQKAAILDSTLAGAVADELKTLALPKPK